MTLFFSFSIFSEKLKTLWEWQEIVYRFPRRPPWSQNKITFLTFRFILAGRDSNSIFVPKVSECGDRGSTKAWVQVLGETRGKDPFLSVVATSIEMVQAIENRRNMEKQYMYFRVSKFSSSGEFLFYFISVRGKLACFLTPISKLFIPTYFSSDQCSNQILICKKDPNWVSQANLKGKFSTDSGRRRSEARAKNKFTFPSRYLPNK